MASIIVLRSGDWPVFNDNTQDCFTKIWIWQANQRAFQKVRLIIEHQLNFPRIDILAAGNNQILVATQDIQVLIFVYPPKITGDKNPVSRNSAAVFSGIYKYP